MNGQTIEAVSTLRWTELFVEYIRPGEARRPGIVEILVEAAVVHGIVALHEAAGTRDDAGGAAEVAGSEGAGEAGRGGERDEVLPASARRARFFSGCK